MIKLGHMVLKVVNWIHNDKLCKMVLKESIGYTMIKLGKMVLNGANWLCNAKIRLYGLERNQLVMQ